MLPVTARSHEELAAWYRHFADHEVAGRSPLYAEITRAVADDRDLLDRLCRLPEIKRQPNLLLAAVRHVCGVPTGWPQFRAWCGERWPQITAVMLSRSTQTNEPGRCAALLPVLASLPGPLALIEVGASAGLCLLPDRYAYDYGDGRRIGPAGRGSAGPVFPCTVDAATPVPDRLPEIVWRAGLDLHPLDPGDAEEAAWLQTLVWPEQQARAQRLAAALKLAAAERPRVVAGDLRDGIDALLEQAPPEATVVVFHTAVLAYLQDVSEREAFGRSVLRSGARWISNEGPHVVPSVARDVPQPWRTDAFLLALDGDPLAWADPHGAWLQWL